MVNLVSQKEFISVFNSKKLIDNGPIRRSNLKIFRKTIKPFKTSKTMLFIEVGSCKESSRISEMMSTTFMMGGHSTKLSLLGRLI